jgi:ABC-type nitrate/sulfonate/bicarbonate transport system substrate-binding protein
MFQTVALRLLFAVILSAGLGSLPGLTSAQQKPKLRPLNIALANHSVTMTGVYVARQLGIFESYGFDARVLVLEPRAAIAAMLTGDLDLLPRSVPRREQRFVMYRFGSVWSL